MGKATYVEVTDQQEAYQVAQRDALDALKEYNVTLSEFDRLTCGAMTKYMKGADMELDTGEGGDAYMVLDPINTPYYYAYTPSSGKAVIKCQIEREPPSVTIQFRDWGRPFDPLAKEDEDITLSAEERGIGGLGIYMVKNTMDDVRYQYENGQNILTIHKKL